MDKVKIGILVMTLIGIGFIGYGFTDSEGAVRVLKQNGYTDIQTDGRDWTNCHNGEIYHTAFTAVASNGDSVSGAVCANIFNNGKTIRTE